MTVVILVIFLRGALEIIKDQQRKMNVLIANYKSDLEMTLLHSWRRASPGMVRAIVLATTVALWLLVYLVSTVGPHGKPETAKSPHPSYAVSRPANP